MRYYTRQARKFLDLNWEKKIYNDRTLKVDEVADMLGFPRYRPSLRMCKRNFGLTIANFFIHCRIAEVKEFLTTPESRQYSLLDIAHKFEFPHRRNFNISFKAVTGITQQEFWYFEEHFKQVTRIPLVEYQQPLTHIYMPESGRPTFLSNFLNEHAGNLLNRQAEKNKKQKYD